MTKLHLGDEMTGNFSTAKPVPELKGARLDKMNGILFLSVGNEKSLYSLWMTMQRIF